MNSGPWRTRTGQIHRIHKAVLDRHGHGSPACGYGLCSGPNEEGCHTRPYTL